MNQDMDKLKTTIGLDMAYKQIKKNEFEKDQFVFGDELYNDVLL